MIQLSLLVKGTPHPRPYQGGELNQAGRRAILPIVCILFSLFAPHLFGAMPQQAPSSITRAEALLQQGKANEALLLLLQLHQSQPRNPQICLQIGIAYTQLEQLKKAAEFYRKALGLSPGLTTARKNLATVLWFLNQKQESVQEFLSVRKALPNDRVPHLYLGTFEYEQKHFLKAKIHFEKAGDLAFKNPEALPMVLETYLALKDVTVPMWLMKQLEQAENPNPELILQFGTLLSHFGVYDQAIKALEKLVTLNSAKPEVYLMLGEAYDKQKMPEKAYEAFAGAIEKSPRSEDGYVALSIFASAHHNNQFALKTLSQGLDKIPNSPKLLLQQGLIWALERNLIQSENSLAKASLADPQWSLPRLALGVSQLQAGKLEEAAQSFREAAKKDAKDYRAEYLYALALIRAGAQGDTTRREEVVAALRRAIYLNPKDPDSRVSLGQTYLAAGRLEAAITELKKAIELDPKNPTAHYQLGIAYRKQGKSETAQRELRTFEEIKAKLEHEEDEERKALVQILKTVREK